MSGSSAGSLIQQRAGRQHLVDVVRTWLAPRKEENVMANRSKRPILEGSHVGSFDGRTEVPTPSGMTIVNDLRPGQVVFGYHGRPVTVLDVVETARPRDCFEVEFSTGERVVVDGEQRLLVERRDRSRAVGAHARRSAAEVADAVASRASAIYAVRVAPAVQTSHRRLPIDPYLLGVWTGIGISGTAEIRGADADLIRHLTLTGARVVTFDLPGQPSQHRVDVGGIVRRGAGLIPRLRELGALDAKYLPLAYLWASEAQRRALLAGLLDATAVISDGGEIVLRAPTAGVAVDAHQLIASLGFRPWFRSSGGVTEVGFVTSAHVFGCRVRQARLQARRRLADDLRPRRLILAVEPVSQRPMKQVRVASEDGLLLVGRSFIPMPGATFEPIEQIASRC